MGDYFVDDGSDFCGVEFEYVVESFDGEGVVEGSVGEEIGVKIFFLDLFGEYGFDFFCVGYEFLDFDVVDEGCGFFLFVGGESFRGLYDVVMSVFWWVGEDLFFVVFKYVVVGFVDDVFFKVGRGVGLGEERDFEEYGVG